MKRLIMMIAVSWLIAACAQEKSEETVSNPAEAKTNPVAVVEAPNDLPPPQPDGYYEYLYCQNGPNFSQENFRSMVTDWNTMIDSQESQPTAAFGYIPRGWENENFDGLWVLRWADRAAMEEGWAAYAANDSQAKLDEMHPGLMTCGATAGTDRFGWTVYVPREAPDSFDPRQSPYYLTNQLCSFNEGQSGRDLRQVVEGKFLPAVEATVAANPDSSYWFRIEARDFEPSEGTQIDTNWVNFWQTAEEGQASAQTFQDSEEGKAIQTAFDAVSTCQDTQAWDGWLLREPAAAE